MVNLLEIWVPGVPKPQGSKRAFIHPSTKRPIMIEDNEKGRDWRADVKLFARDTYVGGPVIGQALSVSVLFIMPRPKSTPKTRPTPHAIKKPDVDKCLRLILDAFTGVVWGDDSQVISLLGSKRIAELDEQPGARISVRIVDEPA